MYLYLDYMRKLFCFFIFLVSFSYHSFAQDRGQYLKNEIKVSYGGEFNTGIADYKSVKIGSIYDYLISQSRIPKDSYSNGIILVSYNRFLTSWLSLGGTFGYSAVNTIFRSNFSGNDFEPVWTHDSFLFMAGVRFHYLNHTWVRLYSDIYSGVNVFRNKEDNITTRRFALQTCLFGISVGKKVSGFAELNAGTEFSGGSVGISVRF